MNELVVLTGGWGGGEEGARGQGGDLVTLFGVPLSDLFPL